MFCVQYPWGFLTFIKSKFISSWLISSYLILKIIKQQFLFETCVIFPVLIVVCNELILQVIN